MLYTIIAIALLFAHPCQSMIPVAHETASSAHAGASAEALGSKAVPLGLERQPIYKVPELRSKDLKGMRKDYMNSEKSYFFIDNDGTIKPPEAEAENTAAYKERVREVLTKLTANGKNQVWLVTAREVSALEKEYGNIPGLNLAGKKGVELRPTNPTKLKLPDVSQIRNKLLQEASAISNRLEIKGDMYSEGPYRLRYMQRHDMAKDKSTEMTEMKKQVAEFIDKDEQFKDFEAIFIEHANQYEVSIQHKTYGTKALIPTLMLEKESPKFALSMGDMDMDEKMHEVMRAAGHRAIIVKKPKSSWQRFLAKYREPEPFDFKAGPAFNSFATHRLDNHQKAIRFLESLVETPKTFSQKFASLWKNWEGFLPSLLRKIHSKLGSGKKTENSLPV
ncbi:hypothetical protein PGT21_009776 [Puccinia graminis f. sp. tritici]|uniref:trehalose-phosphatase n=2 Tax=Puccinia graminis f. sp. tritici TaxID=56615 RepID=E3KI90_PUCGT|nr:uncharacterized protein PGTG_09728 [Puccinia graminis f. sp. tritici CRL 75-36-700-3]EFP84015.1 hypothetical protein PGTG_09728 [Puccinia graminis f. sp. tritici CRL 75-36-700-3]KAA1064622.1 hypothetical protein PGT21_009776 [Puccinia graminis f. sp. tritici]